MGPLSQLGHLVSFFGWRAVALQVACPAFLLFLVQTTPLDTMYQVLAAGQLPTPWRANVTLEQLECRALWALRRPS